MVIIQSFEQQNQEKQKVMFNQFNDSHSTVWTRKSTKQGVLFNQLNGRG